MQGLSFSMLWNPDVLLQAVVMQIIYLLLLSRPIRAWFSGSRKVPLSQIVSFLGGLWVFYFSFGSPIDYMSDELLFSAHMVQHMLEIMLMTPLLIYGIPDWFIRPVLKWKPSAVLFKAWTNPVASAIVFNLCFSGFHIPAIYNKTLVNDTFHLFEHAVFFATAFFMWWPLLSPLPELHRLQSGGRLMYLLFNFNLMMPISVLLIFAQQEWYPFYLTVPRVFGLDPVSDMQLGGLIMLIGMAVPYGASSLISYLKYNEAAWYA